MRRLISSCGSSLLEVPTSTATTVVQQCQRNDFFTATRPLAGLDQVNDVPSSSTRKPSGLHLGPGRRTVHEGERGAYQFMKKWDLQMQDKWDDYEAFKGLPKPKKQFGNEACEIIWPYALLMENVIKVHRFTKSIYLYYPQNQQTPQGEFNAAVARRFSREFLIPITFHNSSVYVETEMLLEYGETPWLVIHCLDGRHVTMPVRLVNSALGDVNTGKYELLDVVVAKCHELGESVVDVANTVVAMHERPLQNQYLRINYQWFGNTPEDRMSHMVQWQWSKEDVEPRSKYAYAQIRDYLNFDGRLPMSGTMRAAAHADKKRLVKSKSSTGARAFLSGQAKRQNARYAKGVGAGSQTF